ncbi:MAG: DUF6588 family protein [Mucilaginibacter sp.]|uniref:DUF6588 family protein n=1 Tax=Mucilaginibacter sp. TaxID=1882438 RepID=UPI003266FE7B
MKKIFTLIVLGALCISKTNAQDISGIFKGGPSDVNALLNAYTNPLFKGFGNGLNGGWTNTAKTQKFLRFAIRVSATGSIVPDADRAFDINSLNLTNIRPTNSGQSLSPTFGGRNGAVGQNITYYNDPKNPALGKYDTKLPDAVSTIIPAPQVQLTVGLIKSTDITLRVIPTFQVNSDVGSLGMFGVGLKHNFSGDFGTASHVIPFDLALAVGYTHLSYTKTLDVKPDANNAGTSGSQDYSNQKLQGDFSGWNAQIILSKKLLFFTPFVSVGYLTSKTDVGLKGNFPFVTGADPITGKPKYTTTPDPITINSSAAATSGARADVGFQMSLFFLKIYGSYSFAEYQSFNGGIGLGF